MKIAMRVDASFQMGSGHLMRCLTLADALKGRNATTRFVCRHIPDGLKAMIEQKGHRLMHVGSGAASEANHDLPHSHWLGTSQAQDANDTLQALSDESWDWIMVDHYALDARWESALRPSAKRIMAIDDVADRQHDCDVLLDQNLYADMEVRYAGKVPSHCQLLLGPRYALLRDEFRKLRHQVKPRTGPIRRVLVFFGGVDAENCTAQAIKALAGLEDRSLQVDVVIGAQHPKREEIEVACEACGYQCHVQTEKMAELMIRADIAIGASGSASWERCCMGLPSLCITLADNQVDIAKSLDAYGAGLLLGDSVSVSTTSLIQSLLSIFSDGERLNSMSVKAMSLVDGIGASRVAEALCG